VVVNHNAGSPLRECVSSIAGQAREVLVVDNGSDPGSAERVLGDLVSDGTCKLLALPRNLGFAAACNHGIREASQGEVLLLNPDCLASPDFVPRLLETLECDPKIGMVGGFLQNPDRTEQRGGRRFIPTPMRSLARGLGIGFLARLWPSLFRDFNLDGTPLPGEAVEVEAVSGACMLLKRAALEEAGMMDEGFFLHCEDLDLCLRFRQRGWKVFFNPHARVLHQKGVCGRRKPAFVEWHKHRGMVRFYKKHFRTEYPAILFPLVVLAVWLRFLVVVSTFWIRPRRQPSNSPETPVYREPPQNGAVVGVPGASGFVGEALVPLLLSRHFRVLAFSRRERRPQHAALEWGKMDPHEVGMSGGISNWISLCPLPVLAGLLPKLAAYGARRLVAVSSTSRFTKADSRDAGERRLAESLAAAEEGILKWGRETGVEVVVLRPTLVYDGVGDKNIAAVSNFIRRRGWFPVQAPASGLRQPLHASDLAAACVSALSPAVPAGAYDLSGGETISYREMVARIFAWQGVPQRFVELPPWLLRFFGILPPFRGVTAGIFERMNKDLVFDHARAAELLDFRPRKFVAPALLGPPW
jgi:GT2 family glycosyltransferase/nucleoside-diphosphate-sugar epimerase